MIKELLMRYSTLSLKDINTLLGKAPTTYAIYYKVKRNKKGRRQICQPSSTTRMMQYCLKTLFFNNFPIHNKAMAYRTKRPSPLLENAMFHKDYDYSVHCDFSNFFPSIEPEDLFTVIKEVFNENQFSDDDFDAIKRACFMYESGKFHLAIGAPISPDISNIVMNTFDIYFDKFAIQNGNSYSRYADDLWYSSKREVDCKAFTTEVEQYLKRGFHSKIKLNHSKTKYYKQKQPRFITGLTVVGNTVKVPRKIKRHVRSLITKKNLSMEEHHSLQGYLCYIRDNEPSYLNTLVLKYDQQFFKQVVRLAFDS